MLSVERIDSIPELRGLRSIWNDLLERSQHANLFLSHEWITTWCDHFGGKGRLWILLVKDGPQVVGIAPMIVRRAGYGKIPARILGLLTNRHVSRADFVIPTATPEVFAALARFWRDQAAEYDVLHLERVPSDSGTMDFTARALQREGLVVSAPVLDRRLRHLRVTGDWQSYLSARSRNARNNITKARNRISARSETVTFVCDRDRNRLDSSMASLFALHSIARKRRTDRAALDERDRKFHIALARDLAEPDGFENWFLTFDGRPIAGLHCIRHGGAIYLLLTDHDSALAQLRPGWCLVEHALREWWGENSTQIVDFNGDSQFLSVWTDRARTTERLSAFHHRPYSRLLSGLRRIKTSIRRGRPKPATRPEPVT